MSDVPSIIIAVAVIMSVIIGLTMVILVVGVSMGGGLMAVAIIVVASLWITGHAG